MRQVAGIGVRDAPIDHALRFNQPNGRQVFRDVGGAGTKVGVGVTGVAGPGGGTPQKPVGTVAISVLVADTDRVRTFLLVGGRELVKFQATQAALNMLRLMLM